MVVFLRSSLLTGIIFFWALALQSAPQGSEGTFPDPLIPQRADPWVWKHSDGYYYFTATVPAYDRIELRRSQTVAGLADATAKVIWRKHERGPMSWHIWAPEMHYIDGKWYIYFAAGRAESIWDIRIYVLENESANPLEGQWTEKGQLKTLWESFSLDATTFEQNGKRYLVWAQKDPNIRGNTNLYIAEMDTPWSITGRQVMITQPDFPWERVGYWVNEGPSAIERNGKVFISYSASATDHNYCVGLLTADAEADLLNPASWQKSPIPVFKSSEVHQQYGPGHSCFTVAEDGKTDLLVYHARSYKEIQGAALDNPDRHTRVKVLRWGKDGTPDFGEPGESDPNIATAAADEESHYLFSYFKGNGEDGLHLAHSTDGIHWKALNQDRSFLQPMVDKDRLMRDPSIVRGPDGIFHMVWTTGWHDQGFGVAHSKDLIHWSEQKRVGVMDHEPGCRNTWAPEIFYDEVKKQYIVFWASTIDGRFPETAGMCENELNHRIYCTTTRDFETWTKARLFFDPGFPVIDSFMARDGDRWVLVTKDETRFPKAKKNLFMAVASQPEGPWTRMGEVFSPDWVEGPSLLKVKDRWLVYFDEYSRKHYKAMETKDFLTWNESSEAMTYPSGMRHGTAFAVTREVAEKLRRHDSRNATPAED